MPWASRISGESVVLAGACLRVVVMSLYVSCTLYCSLTSCRRRPPLVAFL